MLHNSGQMRDAPSCVLCGHTIIPYPSPLTPVFSIQPFMREPSGSFLRSPRGRLHLRSLCLSQDRSCTRSGCQPENIQRCSGDIHGGPVQKHVTVKVIFEKFQFNVWDELVFFTILSPSPSKAFHIVRRHSLRSGIHNPWRGVPRAGSRM